MKMLRAFLFCVLAVVGLSAHAQRTLVPVADFENVPVALATDKPLTSEQVRQAFIEAGEDTKWNVVPVGDGLLEATFVKLNKHKVVVTIRHDAEKYSVAYKGSDNMNFREAQYASFLVRPYPDALSRAEDAAAKQKVLFTDRPDSKFAKTDTKAVIHPFYEVWVHELLDAVRLKLKRAQ